MRYHSLLPDSVRILLAAAAFLGVACSTAPVQEETDGGSPLRVVTYNVLVGFGDYHVGDPYLPGAERRERALAWLAAEQPDVVAFQELTDHDEVDEGAGVAINNPYFETGEWRVWRDDASPIEEVQSLAREDGEIKEVTTTVEAPPLSQRVYPVEPGAAEGEPRAVVLSALPEPSERFAGIWDDVYTSWSGLHGYVRNRWKGSDGSTAEVLHHIIHFVDVNRKNTARAGVNFIHQSTTGVAHTITNGYSLPRTEQFEKLYFADALFTGPAHASYTDQRPDYTVDLYTALFPTIFNSVGSSNSETMAITKMIIAGGYLPPETKLLLKRNGLYPAAILYLWKAALPYSVPYDHELRHRIAYKSIGNRGTYPEKYSSAGIDKGDLSLVYHRYDDGAHLLGMVELASSMTVALPEAVLEIGEIEGGTTAYALKKSVVILQEKGEEIWIRVSTAGCYDLQGLPLTTRWKLLYGNRRTSVESADEDGFHEITIPWDETLPEGRTVIALIASNGVFDSNPAIITVYRKKGDLPPDGLSPGGYRFPGTFANRRPVLLGLQDQIVKPGKTIEIPIAAVDPEGFPVRLYRRDGEVGELDGNLFTWRCPRKEPEGPRTVTFIASDGTNGNSYGGKQITLHVGAPDVLAQIHANHLVGPAPLTVEVSAKDSRSRSGKLEFWWDFYTPAVGRKHPAFEDLVHGKTASHTFETPGHYRIELTAQGPAGSDVETVEVLVTAKPLAEHAVGIRVEGGGVTILSGDETQNRFDDTAFGSVEIGQEVVHEFTLLNRGRGPLTLKGSRSVALRGPRAKAFRVTRQPRVRIDGPGSSRFAIRFKPTEPGACAASVQIRSGAETFEFTIGGVGVPSSR